MCVITCIRTCTINSFFKMWHKTDQYSYALIMRTENFNNFTQVVHMIFSNVYTLS